MDRRKEALLAVANDCHTSFHKDMCAPVELFKVHDSHDGCIYLIPNHDRGIDYFFGSTMAYIGDYLNNHDISWRVVVLNDSVALKLFYGYVSYFGDIRW